MDTTRHTDFFSKMVYITIIKIQDPYVKVIYNGQEQHTKVQKKGGQHVNFDDVLTFPFQADHQSIRFECWDVRIKSKYQLNSRIKNTMILLEKQNFYFQ